MHLNLLSRSTLAIAAGALLTIVSPPAARSEESPAPITDWLVVGPLRGSRSAVHRDPVEFQLVTGQWKLPAAGDAVAAPDGVTRTWRRLAAGASGVLSAPELEGGYALAIIHVDRPYTALVDAGGHNMVYVDGDPRAGDPYQTGWVRIPVRWSGGDHTLLFQCSRGELHASITRVDPATVARLDTRDTTLPGFTRGSVAPVWGAIVIEQMTGNPGDSYRIVARCAGGRSITTMVPSVPSLGSRKVGFQCLVPRQWKTRDCPVHLSLQDQSGKELDSAVVTIAVRAPGELINRTFISSIDGSVQTYAELPARRPSAKGLLLSLHGAGVNADGQAASYEQKPDISIVAPTNRRPFGFDWEDWGRMDALEVLGHAEEDFHPDPRQIYLGGHSMGGHGTWILGAQFPGRFAAIAPSAGWASFFSYTGSTRPATDDPVGAILNRAASASDTLALLNNLATESIYVLHGSADDNVPVTEARDMVARLRDLHADIQYHEEPGVGHWWDRSPEPGVDCVDWAGFFDLFENRRLPAFIRHVDFTTVDPGISASRAWATIEAQIHSHQPARIQIECDPGLSRFVGTTENVARLTLDQSEIYAPGPIEVSLDGDDIKGIPWPDQGGQIHLERVHGHWATSTQFAPTLKTPARCGPFKAAFANRMVLVYGTHGTPEENRWAIAKVRYDAEAFRYRGNGSIDITSDDGLPGAFASNRSIILYGNADTNSAWKVLLKDSPIQVHEGSIHVGQRLIQGADLACLFVRPCYSSVVASVAAVSGTGPVGMRLTDRLPYFVSGIHYPDWMVLGVDSLQTGLQGVRAAGYFGPDWSLESGDSAFH